MAKRNARLSGWRSKGRGLSRPFAFWLSLCALATALVGCLPVTQPSVKIGLVAPFEGRYREVGYEVIYAVRLAVREANAAGGAGGHRVELVALDDSGEAELAPQQARKLAADPGVVGALGHWLPATTQAAAPAYGQGGLPLLAVGASDLVPEPPVFRLWPAPADFALAAEAIGAENCPPECQALDELGWLTPEAGKGLVGPPLWTLQQFADVTGAAAEGMLAASPAPLPSGSTDKAFADRYTTLAGEVPPRAYAVFAYDAAQALLAAIATDVQQNGVPSRTGTAAALAGVSHEGIGNTVVFDEAGGWGQSQVRLFVWRNGRLQPANR